MDAPAERPAGGEIMELWLRIQDGDHAAWAAFQARCAALLNRWGRRAGLQTADCEDLVQGVAVELLAAHSSFRADAGAFHSWLWGIAQHKIADLRSA